MPQALRAEVRRLTETERNFYCGGNQRTRDCKTFASLAPLTSVTHLIVYAHRYISSRKLDIECEACVWAMVDRMQVPHSDPLFPLRPEDGRQQDLFHDTSAPGASLSSRTIANVLLESRQWSEAELAGRCKVPLDAIGACRRGARVAPWLRQALMALYSEHETQTAVMGV